MNCHSPVYLSLPKPSEQLIRSAFQCVQLIAGDLLGCAGPRCLRRVLAAAAAFAQQTRELNISLTAVGLMVSAKYRHVRIDGAVREWFCKYTVLLVPSCGDRWRYAWNFLAR